MKKVLSLLALTLVLSLSFTINVPNVQAADTWNTARYGDVYDIGTKLRALEKDDEYKEEMDSIIKEYARKIKLNPSKIKENAPKSNFKKEEATNEENGEQSFTYNGGTKYMLALDEFNGYYLKTFTLRSIGENVEVWIADDLSYGDDRPAEIITQEQADHMRDVFDAKVYPTDTAFFGMHDSHTGENATLPGMIGLPADYYTSADGVERVMLLVDHFKDTNYYYPQYPLIIGGFYSSAFENYMDRNIINITARNWAERLDEDWLPTTAHEFQHLIHDDNDSSEETWINEGMSDFAEYLCFGTHPTSHVNSFIDYPENSLVEWDEHANAETGPETLADYGQAYLMQLYLNDQYGRDFIQTLAKYEKQGIEGVNEVLADFGADIDFEELFRRFTIAVAIDSPQPGNGIYNFDSIDININYESALEFDKDGVPAWGADYKILDEAKKIRNIKFDGIEFFNPWKVVDDPYENRGEVFWGNNGNLMDNQLIFKADLNDAQNPILKFDTFIDIEPEWDAGMVQVSTDNGNTWTSLANENTIDQDAFPFNEQAPQIYNNLPGLSVNNTEWVTEEFDLSQYAGQEILISFRYMTDGAYNDTGWFIDNIEIPEIGISNDCSSLDGFYSIDEIQGTKVEYAITFINKKTFGNGMEAYYKVLNIDPLNITEEDSVQLKGFFVEGTNYMVVWYAAPVGNKGTVEFTYEIITQEDFVDSKKK